MAGQRIDMMEIRALIRLKQKNLSNRKAAQALGVDRKTVDAYVGRFKALELSYDELSTLNEKDLLELFTVESQTEKERYEQLAAQFDYFKKELNTPGCTLGYLHSEYINKYPQGYRYTQFCLHFRTWLGKTKPGGKLVHKAAEKLFIDFCGKKLSYTDRATGEVIPVEVFVGILPCSQYTFVKAVNSQKREDTISCLTDCLDYLGGVPQSIVCDNLKAAVTKAHKYAPVINKTLKDFALHYDCTIDPARPYHPTDKALVEGAVKLVYQRIYYPLSKQTFFSLESLNEAIKELLKDYNDYLFSHGGYSRRQEFIDVEKNLLAPLPQHPYSMRYYHRAKVQLTSHVWVNADKNYYSVPHRYQGLHVQVQFNQEVVEIFYNYDRIALHKRSYKAGQYTTAAEHMPPANQFFMKWNPEYFLTQAEKMGPSVKAYIDRLLNQYDYPQHAYKQCQGILAMAKQYGAERLEIACQRGLSLPRSSYHTIDRILRKGLDLWPETYEPELLIPTHENIRGEHNYI